MNDSVHKASAHAGQGASDLAASPVVGAATTEQVTPHLTKFSAVVKMTTGSGARLDYDYRSGTAPPHKVIVAVIRDLARIAAVAGLRSQVEVAVYAAFKDAE